LDILVIILNRIIKNFNKEINKLLNRGFGDWGWGIGDWGLGPIPNPQSPF